MKKILSTILLLAMVVPFIADAQTLVPQGGTGITTIPDKYFVMGSSSLRTQALSTTTVAALLLQKNGTVTSVAATVPTGLSVSGSPITTSGTLAFTLTSGYVIPLTASTTEWAAAYASTTALTPAYIRGLFSNTATGLSYDNTTGITSLAAGFNIPKTASTTNWASLFDTPFLVMNFATGTAGNDFHIATSAKAITFNLPDASATARGAVTTGNQTFAGTKTFSSTISGSINGNAGTATTLQTGRTIAISGDLTYTSPSFDGSTNVTAAGTLATVNSNVGTFTYPSVTVNGKGLITAISNGTAPINAWSLGSGFIYHATSSDSVSIGTTTPFAKLSVHGSSGSTLPLFTVASSTSATGATSTLFTVLPNGFVGVGVLTPTAKLQVTTDANWPTVGYNSSQLRITGSTNTNQRLGIGYSTTGDFGFIQAALEGSAFEPLVLNPAGGSVGVGTSTPLTTLQVTAAAANATTTLTVGKVGQTKGSCLELYRGDGSVIYASVAAGATTFTLSTGSCK